MKILAPTHSVLCAALLCSLLGPHPRAAGDAAQAPEGVVLPESPSARVWAGVDGETKPVDLTKELIDDHRWLAFPEFDDPRVRWGAWATWLKEEAAAEAPDPQRRAGLALIALRDERWEDAWRHFDALTAHPEWAAALMPSFLPGLPLGHAAGPGGLPLPGESQELVLRPALPPTSDELPRGHIETRTARLSGVRLGKSILDFELTVEPAGVQFDVVHVSGEPVELRVKLPVPPEIRITVDYVDWLRQDTLGEELVVRLAAGQEEPVTLFGRFRMLPRELPRSPVGPLPAGLKATGLCFLQARSASVKERAEVRALSRAIGWLLEVPTSRWILNESGPEPPVGRVQIHLERESGPRLLKRIVGEVEKRVLETPASGH